MNGVAVGMLRLYNTMSRSIEEFKPIEEGLVKIYFCGMTVQDEPHIGHARSFIVADVLVRLLQKLGYKVVYVRNITDVDDKIINKALEEGVPPQEIADRYIRKFLEAAGKLNLIEPNIEPRATCHIHEIIDLVKKLIEKGFAYVTDSGDVYFDVTRFKEYGKLSGQTLERLKAGARIEPGEEKKNPFDFALWKSAKPGEPSWPSPWGNGRPGWHIECSAMSMKYLGETFDIHGGGSDLIFPHHENEVAQSEGATGKPFARYWFHVGLVNFAGDKMSKSLGNVVRVLELLKIYEPETIRYWAISAHYRKPLDFSFESLDAAEKALDSIYRWVFYLESIKTATGPISSRIKDFVQKLKDDFFSELKDDLNTPNALAVLHSGLRELEDMIGKLNTREAEYIAKAYRELGWILGILQQSLEERIREKKVRNRPISTFLPPSEAIQVFEGADKFIDLLVQVRGKLREKKMYEIADYIRDELRKLGISLEDTRDGTIWKPL